MGASDLKEGVRRWLRSTRPNGALVVACAAAWLVPALGWSTAQAAGRPEIRRVQSWQQLTPDQKKRALENFQRYQRLPEASRQRLQQRYDRFQKMPPSEQEQVRKSYDVYRQMTPTQRQDFTNRYERWKGGQK